MSHFINTLAQVDPAVFDLVAKEKQRQASQIPLIASENLVSQAVLDALGSVFTNKTIEGYVGRRYHGGSEFADQLENLAIDRACTVFNCEYANVQPHSGSQANQTVYNALLIPDDVILAMSLSAGGHLSHGYQANISGQLYQTINYGVKANGFIDYEEVEALALKHQPKLIIAGGSSYPREIDYARFKNIAFKVNAYLMVDMAHFSGLVAAGVMASPIPYADIVTTSTYKSIRGPRGGLILSRHRCLATKLDNALFPGVQGTPALNQIAAKAVALKECQSESFVAYSHACITNAKAVATKLTQRGIQVVTDGTDGSMVMLDLRKLPISGKEACERLEDIGIICNKNLIPNDPQPPSVTSGLRLSSNAGTTRGFTLADFEEIADIMADSILGFKSQRELEGRVEGIATQYSIYD